MKSEHLYLIKLGEISLKGQNRNFFERVLRKNIRRRLPQCTLDFQTQKGRMFMRAEPATHDDIAEVLSKTFGIQGFAPAISTEKDISAILAAVDELLAASSPDDAFSFKVTARRSDKQFHLDSYGICCAVGDAVGARYSQASVDLHNPDITISVEIRNRAFIYISSSPGPGGLPVGCAGRGLLLLSGGIDSPVAGFRMAKRGLRQDAIYFHTYPYTSDEARKKVEDLADILKEYIPGLRLFTVPFTAAQLHINRVGKAEEHTLLMRYAMVKIANIVAAQLHASCLVTGESLSQVASQTLESLTFTDSASDLLILRPLIGLDKEEIIRTAQDIGSYETSILPYEDCCTIFSPKHPLVRPDRDEMTERFEKLQIEPLLEEAARKTLQQPE